ncbi:hypothetical protein CUU64_14080 [Bacillus sp. V5-8f]|nr:hypothetical protein CUU64_14080 [Bacillus sp. V5-8f]
MTNSIEINILWGFLFRFRGFASEVENSKCSLYQRKSERFQENPNAFLANPYGNSAHLEIT